MEKGPGGKRGTDVRQRRVIEEQGACGDVGSDATNTTMGWPRRKPKPSSKMRGTVSTEFRRRNILKRQNLHLVFILLVGGEAIHRKRVSGWRGRSLPGREMAGKLEGPDALPVTAFS